MAIIFNDLSLNTYEIKGDLDGVEMTETVKAENLHNAITILGARHYGFVWNKIEQTKKAFNFVPLICVALPLVLTALWVLAVVVSIVSPADNVLHINITGI